MKKAIFGFLYFKVLGWKAVVNVPDYDKYIVCAAPHTSNWDLFIGKLFYGAIGRDSGFLMKKDWFFWPLGPIFRWMGGIPVERKKRTSLVDQIIKIAKERKTFRKVPVKPIRNGKEVFITSPKVQTSLFYWQVSTSLPRPLPSIRNSILPMI